MNDKIIGTIVRAYPESKRSKRELGSLKGKRSNRGIRGRRTSMQVGQFVHSILSLNEVARKEERLTDSGIKDLMLREFAEFPNTVRFLRNKERNPIAYYRHRYNKGTLNRSLVPEKLSVRYDRLGNAVQARDPSVKLTLEDYVYDLARYGLGASYSEVDRTYSIEDASFVNEDLFDELQAASKTEVEAEE